MVKKLNSSILKPLRGKRTPYNVSIDWATAVNTQGLPERYYGCRFENGRLVGVGGSFQGDVPTQMAIALNLFKSELRQAFYEAGIYSMGLVFQEAIKNAPFWDPARKYRPRKEGVHLQESAELTIGAFENTVIGYVSPILGPDRIAKVNTSEIVIEAPKKYTNRKLAINISFYRLRPPGRNKKSSYFDVALYMHEKLKYLENAINFHDPEGLINEKMREWIADHGTRKSANQAMEYLNKFRKGTKTIGWW